ncbi:MAG: lipoyl domain-containing protein [Hydrogenophaga sp.]|uniref:lipoyl domain-containing protein n=1 Tax=Hydrogenophaga sp. TaxID=1904254 RepID=UPI00271F10F5|nr:lipoyl domain-containing protein [Hydrogenophaga sp.]MDO9147178.1 lipoyl domain-containing protein [Hydrogenophaga sp.]MDO9604052.1 lipoyl domain-containing protein [Hydrogenophaga sp.]MDP2165943.1 lipoyl domain-containing protein [Hydrogenophaga sp.]MDP3476186.1 lipoyl domain-containing protein [Hydrogenophaga sp.]
MHDVMLDPRRWESIEAGDLARLDRWLVSEGDHVGAGQLLAQARLLHQTLDITAPHAGVVEQILVGNGEPIGHGATLARLVPI